MKNFQTENKLEVSSTLACRDLSGKLWKLSYPTMISMGLQVVYDMVDMAWVGQLSPYAISGVTLFSTIYFLFAILNDIAGASSVSMISQNYGRGDMERTKTIAEQTISFKVVLAIISATLLAICLKPLLYFFTSEEIVIQNAISYGWLRILFMPIMFSSYSVNTIFRCTDDAKMPMHIMLVSFIINVILDPIFMFDIIPGTSIPGFGMGIFGASLATVIARLISFLFGFLILLAGKRKMQISFKGLFKLDKEIDKKLLFIGLPSGANALVRTLSQTLVMKFVAVYGAGAIALSGVGGKFMMVIFMPIFGFNSGGATLVGHSLGRENVKEAKTIAKLAASLCFVGIAFFTIIMFFASDFLLGIFFKDLELIAQGAFMLKVFFASSLMLSISLGLATVFSGSGYMKPMLYSTIGARFLTQLPYLLVVVTILHLPLHMVWFSFTAGEITELLVVLYHYKKGKWQHKRV